jgi:integrase
MRFAVESAVLKRLWRILARERLAQLAQARRQARRRGRPDRRRRLYDLRHAFASLLIHKGRLSVVEIAAHFGHDPAVCLDTYAHVMAEQDSGERVSAEEQIEAARRGSPEESSDLQLAFPDIDQPR